MKAPTTQALRAWADDAEKHGMHFVPVGRDTLRALAAQVELMTEALRSIKARVLCSSYGMGSTVDNIATAALTPPEAEAMPAPPVRIIHAIEDHP